MAILLISYNIEDNKIETFMNDVKIEGTDIHINKDDNDFLEIYSKILGVIVESIDGDLKNLEFKENFTDLKLEDALMQSVLTEYYDKLVEEIKSIIKEYIELK